MAGRKDNVPNRATKPADAEGATSLDSAGAPVRAPRPGRLLPVITFLPQTDASVFSIIGKRQFTIGRDPDSDILIPDGRVSCSHAVIYYENFYSPDRPPSCIIEDRGSRNGTYVNGARIDRPQPLQHRDTILIGGVSLGYYVRSELELGMTEGTIAPVARPRNAEKAQERVFLNLKVTVEALFPDNKFSLVRFEGAARDLSRGGIRIVTSDLARKTYLNIVRSASSFRIKTSLPGNQEETVLLGRLAWVHFDDERQPPQCALGMTFESLVGDSGRDLLAFLDQIS